VKAAGGSRGRLIGDIQPLGFTHAMTSTEFHASLISGDLYSRKTEGLLFCYTLSQRVDLMCNCPQEFDSYCPLLKRMHLIRTPWVESLNTHEDCRGANVLILSKTSFSFTA
jgi:hypothetical protein